MASVFIIEMPSVYIVIKDFKLSANWRVYGSRILRNSTWMFLLLPIHSNVVTMKSLKRETKIGEQILMTWKYYMGN